MPTRVSESTLEQFRQAAAGQMPTPAGVAIAAVSAAFALGLLAKALTVAARRKTLADDTARLQTLAAAAQVASQRMLQLAGEDSAAFEAYLAARRLPRATEPERQARERDIDTTVRRAIDVPLEAAQEAAAGLQLCNGASALTPLALIADLGVAATLLAGALRGFLLCAESNVRQLAPAAAAYRAQLAAETKRHERALQQAQAVLEQAGAALESAAILRSE
ncbi:MAG TPA: cyclodeaminase/cyclohydrolase family protein [Steroidobacteraceae bacterium]|nr:cyclodeaminase/cyclohydrolase family protein [Steroidobacteraceae bacterium]